MLKSRVVPLFLLLVFALPVVPQQTSFPVKREENAASWRSSGLEAVRRARKRKQKRRKARNVILFVGDGMGISTLTAARILEGQLRGESGEENLLSFERFSDSAFSRTYSVNQQTSDSAPTMSAMITGVKTLEGVVSMTQDGRAAESLVELAEKKGKSTGVVSTARITHATPAACYAHTMKRGFESDAHIKRFDPKAYESGAVDIARQLLEFSYGDGLEVVLGGGRQNFLPAETVDPEYSDEKGVRLDRRDLTKEWTSKYRNSKYVWNKSQFDQADPESTDHLLGLFERSHMQYEHDRKNDKGGEPSLVEMTSKAIEILSKNKRGYVLVVEAGRIDHAHHNGNAYRALTDTIELSNAVRAAVQKVNLKKTMIVVTADHSHGFTIGGYPARGNNILGFVREVAEGGGIEKEPSLDRTKKPYTTLRYADGPGHVENEKRPTDDKAVTNPDFKQMAAIPLWSETHAGEDVAIFAEGVNSWMFSGSMEQNWIYYIMRDALRF
ncbi:MAG: alkaline phosphatase [Pyrinomonadaceae bacterium]|nr:alkaline phosphatase [Pyrinomonadaceae bacterium]